MGGSAFEKLNQGRFGSSQYFVDLMDLVKFSLTIEERVLGDHFEQHTTVTPDVHFGIVVAVSHQALGSTIPSCRNILSVGLFRIDT